MKNCTSCNQEKDEAEFNKRSASKDGLSYDCKKCNIDKINARRKRLGSETVREERRASYKKHRVATKGRVRLARYGMSREDYEARWVEQKGSCKCCGTELIDVEDYDARTTRPPNGAVIDHCHDSGDVRGIICHYCNLMLGYAQDNPDKLKAGIAYLVRFVLHPA